MDFDKKIEEVGRDLRTKPLNSGGHPDSFVDPGSFSMILYNYHAELQIGRKLTFCRVSQQVTDFDEIFGGVGCGATTNRLHFGGDPDYYPDPGFWIVRSASKLVDIIALGRVTRDLLFRKLGKYTGNRNIADFWRLHNA